jgi:hypothetical protein
MIESVVQAKNGLQTLGLCGEGKWRTKEVIENFELKRSGRDDGGWSWRRPASRLVVSEFMKCTGDTVRVERLNW